MEAMMKSGATNRLDRPGRGNTLKDKAPPHPHHPRSGTRLFCLPAYHGLPVLSYLAKSPPSPPPKMRVLSCFGTAFAQRVQSPGVHPGTAQTGVLVHIFGSALRRQRQGDQSERKAEEERGGREGRRKEGRGGGREGERGERQRQREIRK